MGKRNNLSQSIAETLQQSGLSYADKVALGLIMGAERLALALIKLGLLIALGITAAELISVNY
ncbi:MAG: hypothetical protein MI754_07295 [Chromatiales bacterium]|nr:hypothetical protein [Chromatiales bacterium]